MTQENTELMDNLSAERDKLALQRMNLPKCPMTGFYLDREQLEKLSERITALTIMIAPPEL